MTLSTEHHEFQHTQALKEQGGLDYYSVMHEYEQPGVESHISGDSMCLF